MVQHHLVVFATDARLLVATEGGVSRVLVVAVGPHAAGLDGAAHAVGDVAVAAPDAGAEAVQGVVGDFEGFGFVLEGGHGEHRPEDFFLEDAHLVVALEQGRLDVITAGQFAFELSRCATDQAFGAFLLAEFQVGLDLGHLFLRALGAHHGVGVERAALLDGGDASQHAFDELVVDRFLDQRAARAGTHFALVEGEQHHAFDGLVEEAVILVHDVGEEDVRRLAAQFQRCRDQVVGGGLGNHAARGGGAGENNGRDGARGQVILTYTVKSVKKINNTATENIKKFGGVDLVSIKKIGGLSF